jgi:hypothetical protein
LSYKEHSEALIESEWRVIGAWECTITKKHKLAAGELLNAVEAPMRENAHFTQMRRE